MLKAQFVRVVPTSRPLAIRQFQLVRVTSGPNGEPVASEQAEVNTQAYIPPVAVRRNESGSRSSSYSDEPEITGLHFGGALSSLILGASLLSERLNGIGIVQNLELHNKGFHPLLLGTIFGLMCAAAWPEARETKNPSTVVRWQMAGARVAYLGLAAAIAAEMFTGKGVLTLLDFETGIEAISDIEAGLVFLVMLFLTGPQKRSLK